MADKKTSNAEENKNVKAEKADSAKKSSAKAEKKKSKKKNPFKSAGKFFKSVNAERKKVVWPKAKETLRNSLIVLVVVIIAGVAIYAVDSLLALGLRETKQLAEPSTSVSETVEDTTAAADTDTSADTTVASETQAAE